MRAPSPRILASAAILLATALPPAACRGDGQGILVQANNGRLVVGYDDDTPGGQSIGARVFGELLPSTGLSQDPSFLSVASPPVGVDALPAGLDVYWDFLPMTIGDATAGLFYWDGAGEVDFTPASAETLTLHDPEFVAATTDGSAAATPGLRIGTTTSSALSLHAHRYWWLQQGDEEAPTAGVYATALRLRADGYVPSEPVFVAFSTFGLASAVLNDAAMPWLEENVDSLILAGDYDFDGVVGPSDYALWRSQYGTSAPQPVDVGEADGNRDGIINAADYTLWRDQIAAAPVASLSSSATPEPSSLAVALAGAAVLALTTRRGRSVTTQS